jgi:hypothetical protein
VASYVAEGNKEFAQRELLVLQQLIDEDPHERADFNQQPRGRAPGYACGGMSLE